jgi:hypothetical protein
VIPAKANALNAVNAQNITQRTSWYVRATIEYLLVASRRQGSDDEVINTAFDVPHRELCGL